MAFMLIKFGTFALHMDKSLGESSINLIYLVFVVCFNLLNGFLTS